MKLELLSNATTIDSALNYISSKQHKKLASELASKDTLTTTVAGKQTDIKTLYMITRI